MECYVREEAISQVVVYRHEDYRADAITVHKSQGCEYPIVILPLYSAPSMLLTRNLFYTAVTRAQRMVVLVGRAEIAQTMVANHLTSHRYTCLKQRLLVR